MIPTASRINDVMTGSRTFIFLGTGTSVGVPMVGCRCEVCGSTDSRNHRLRCSVLINTPRGNLLIDTGPDLRTQLLRERVERLDAVLYTHYHADHLMGLDDLRPFPIYTGQPVPLYCTQEVEERIRVAFNYAFPVVERVGQGFIPRLTFERIATTPFDALGERVTPITLEHAGSTVLGFRIDNIAYCTDVSRIPDESWPLLADLDVLVLDALRYKPHPAHFCVNDALEVVARVKPRRTIFTHMGHDIDHETLARQLPAGVEPAYDGLRFVF